MKSCGGGGGRGGRGYSYSVAMSDVNLQEVKRRGLEDTRFHWSGVVPILISSSDLVCLFKVLVKLRCFLNSSGCCVNN